MNCRECRAAILLADRAELQGAVPGELRDHLVGCAACRTVTLRLEGSTEMLAAMHLARPASRHAVERRPSSRAAIAAFAAITVAAALLMWISSQDRMARISAVAPARLVAPSGVSMRPAVGHRATVIPSPDPKVTIFWLSEGGAE